MCVYRHTDTHIKKLSDRLFSISLSGFTKLRGGEVLMLKFLEGLSRDTFLVSCAI